MTVTAYTFEDLGASLWRVNATSDLTAPVWFYWYVDGVFQGSETAGEWLLQLDADEQVDVVAVDTTDPAAFDVEANAPTVYAARRTIWWTRSTDADTASYRIYQKAGAGSFVLQDEVLQADEWEHAWRTDRLTDLETYTWEVRPVDAAGNEGTALSIGPELIVRQPDAPSFTVAFNAGATTVTFTEA